MFNVNIPIKDGILREMSRSDIGELVSICQDPLIQKMYFSHVPYSWISYWNQVLEMEYDTRMGELSGKRNVSNMFPYPPSERDTYRLIIEHGHKPAGMLALDVYADDNPYVEMLLPSKDSMGVEISCFIGPQYRKRGIAESVFDNIIPFIFNELEMDLIVGVVDVKNLASQGLSKKYAFRRSWEGKSLRDDHDQDVVVVSLLNPRTVVGKDYFRSRISEPTYLLNR